jgi:hypothetical protein
MNIKNYTSTVDYNKSMAKINQLLVEIGADNVNYRYENKICTGVTFLLFDEDVKQTIAFHLKTQVEEVFTILFKDVKRPRPETKENCRQQAMRTAWKILADWTEIQCSMVLLKQAKPLQMFLPFMYDHKSNQTVYEKLISGKTNLLTNGK